MTGIQAPKSKMDDVIHVNLHGIMEGRLIVSSLNSIQHALNHLGLSNCRAVANGILLCPALSFKYYGIDEGSNLYLVPPADFNTKNPAKKPKPSTHITIPRTRATPQQRLMQSLAPSSQREYARLSDVFRLRVESNPFHYRKVIARAEASLNKPGDSISDAEKTVIPEKPTMPSTELLPLFMFDAVEGAC